MNIFKAGDIAIYDGPVADPEFVALISTGDEVTLVRRDFIDGEWVWFIDLKHDQYDICADEKYLRKKHPPEQPADDQEFIDWFSKTIKRDPITEPQVREGLKGILQPFDNWFEPIVAGDGDGS